MFLGQSTKFETNLHSFKGVRDLAGAQKSIETAIKESLTKGKVFYEKCDTGDMETVREFAKKVKGRFPAIHVLINNGNDLENLLASLSSITTFSSSWRHGVALQGNQGWI